MLHCQRRETVIPGTGSLPLVLGNSCSRKCFALWGCLSHQLWRSLGNAQTRHQISFNVQVNRILLSTEVLLLRTFISHIPHLPRLTGCPITSFLFPQEQLLSLPTHLPSPSVGQFQQETSLSFTSQSPLGFITSLDRKTWELHPHSTYV